MIRFLFTLVLIPFLVTEAAKDASPFISVEEIEPGDKGEWRTAVTGNVLKTFPLEVVGILESFSGPGMPIILCRAVDEENTLTGPVSGMSGSPVYIDGRLAGAYAYGFPWSKEKTLIGVTPIDWMLPLLDKPDQSYRNTQDPTTPGDRPDEESVRLGIPDPFETITAAAGDGTSPSPLPIPLMASGVDAETLRALSPWLEERGIRLTAGAAGSAGKRQPGDHEYEPGSPVSVILADGDLRIGGVGTVTWVDGDRILAYGHPMLGSGATELPLGGAEVVDVVSSYRISFKLSNIGAVEGTLWQDSTSGIQGEIGRIPYMIPIRVESDAGIKSPVVGSLAEHRSLTSSMALIYVAQTLLAAEEGPAEATLDARFSIEIEGETEPVVFHRRGTGFFGALDCLFFFAGNLDRILNGTQEFPRLASLDVQLKTENTEKSQKLHAIRLDSARIRAGDDVRLEIQTRNRGGELVRHRIGIPVPADAAGEDFSVLVADADTLISYEGFRRRDPTETLDELLAKLRRFPGNGEIHIQLIRPLKGLRLEGRNLENLPPSVLSLDGSSLHTPGDRVLNESVVWEKSIPVPGVFSGSARIQFNTEP